MTDDPHAAARGAPIHVLAGALIDAAGRVLITKRPDHVHQGGLWELPGGKREAGETAEACLARELAEELGIQVCSSRPLIRVRHRYGDRDILLDVRRIESYYGEPRGCEGQPITWALPETLDPGCFPAADRPVLTALKLPQLCLVTGEDPRNRSLFIARLQRAMESGMRLVLLRAHALSDLEYAALARPVFDLCQSYGARLILHRTTPVVANAPRHGLHLTSRALLTATTRPGSAGELVGASCHNAAELAQSARLGLDYALLSPVQTTASHPHAIPLGWDTFQTLVDPVPLPVFALGGLGPADLTEAVERGAQGIAAIRGLWPAE